MKAKNIYLKLLSESVNCETHVLFVRLLSNIYKIIMPKKGGPKGKKKDQWPDDEKTEQLTENMKKLTSADTSAASSVCRCADTSDPGHFGPKTLRTYRSSDPGHFGM